MVRWRKYDHSFDAWERLFCLKGLRETPSIDQIPGFGDRNIYKGRVVPLRENAGKSKGYRVVFELHAESACTVLVFSRHGIYHTEGELLALIKSRLIR
jgi:hypothetical protein